MNNKTLAIIFGMLLLLAAFMFLFQSGKDERTFREVLVDIDTSAVTEIFIEPKSKEHVPFRLSKENNEWKVSLPSGGTAEVTDQQITNLFNQLLAIQPKRLAARDESKWTELQVDSTGTRVKVFEDSDLTLDLVIGRFSFQQPRTMNTFVRLYNDKDVYEVDGFLDMTFNQGPNIFRNGTIINSDFQNWQQIQFVYPADSSFQLVNSSSGWLLNGMKTDSAKTINYLNRLRNLSGNKFIDNPSSVVNTTPAYTLNITTKDMNFVEVKCYQDSTTSIIHSSQNPEAWFDGASLTKTIFVGRSNFISN